MGMILRIASSRIVGQGDIVGRSGYFSLNLSANSVMRGRLDARRTLKSLVADLRVDYITWKIVDKKVAKRTAVQEQIILPLRAQNYATCVPGRKSERTVFTMAKFTIPDGKCLVVELNEKNGGRHQSFVIENEDLVRAGTINELQVR